MIRFMGSSRRWAVREGCDAAWKQKMLILFADFKYPQYAVLELWMSIVLGLTTGLVLPHKWVCTAQIVICIIGYGVLLLVDVVLRPGLSMYTQSFLLLSNGLGVLSSAANMWAFSTDSPAAQSMSILPSLLISVLSAAKSTLDIAILALAVPRLLRTSRASLAELGKRKSGKCVTRLEQTLSEMRQPLERAQEGAVAELAREEGPAQIDEAAAGDSLEMSGVFPMMQVDGDEGMIDALLYDAPAPRPPVSDLLGDFHQGVDRARGTDDDVERRRQAAVDAALRLLYSS